MEAEIVRRAIEESLQRIAITTGQESLTLSIQEIDYQRQPKYPLAGGMTVKQNCWLVSLS